VAEFLRDQLCDIGVDHIIDLHHLSLFHQELYDIDRALGHTIGQLLDRDCFRQLNLALNFDALALEAAKSLQLLALALALERSETPLFLFLIEGVSECQTLTARPLHRALFDWRGALCRFSRQAPLGAAVILLAVEGAGANLRVAVPNPLGAS
jgi:hypothetical protein